MLTVPAASGGSQSLEAAGRTDIINSMLVTMKQNPMAEDWTEVNHPDPSDILLANLMSAKQLNPEARSKATSLNSASSSKARSAVASVAGQLLQRAKARSESSVSAAAASAFGLSAAPSILKSDTGEEAAGSQSAVSQSWDLMSMSC